MVRFYERFHNKRWRLFNSGKICRLTYAKIQGKKNLESHFRTSTIMKQVDRNLKPLIYPDRKQEEAKEQSKNKVGGTHN